MFVPYSAEDGTAVSISATTSSSRNAISMGNNHQVKISNESDSLIHVRFGDDTVAATTSDNFIKAGSIEVVSVNSDTTHVAAITASGSGDVLFIPVTGG